MPGRTALSLLIAVAFPVAAHQAPEPLFRDPLPRPRAITGLFQERRRQALAILQKRSAMHEDALQGHLLPATLKGQFHAPGDTF